MFPETRLVWLWNESVSTRPCMQTLMKVQTTTGLPSSIFDSAYVVYGAACVYRELYGKVIDPKKIGVNNSLIDNKVFLPQMYHALVSCADFEAFLTSFRKVIRNSRHSIHRWSDVTPQITLSLKGRVPNRNKTNSFIKPNKFCSTYVCFGGRKTREERKILLKVYLFVVSSDMLVSNSARSNSCYWKLVSSLTPQLVHLNQVTRHNLQTDHMGGGGVQKLRRLGGILK